jgi:hypothetical protein
MQLSRFKTAGRSYHNRRDLSAAIPREFGSMQRNFGAARANSKGGG